MFQKPRQQKQIQSMQLVFWASETPYGPCAAAVVVVVVQESLTWLGCGGVVEISIRDEVLSCERDAR